LFFDFTKGLIGKVTIMSRISIDDSHDTFTVADKVSHFSDVEVWFIFFFTVNLYQILGKCLCPLTIEICEGLCL
jgi:hypothetical protein